MKSRDYTDLRNKTIFDFCTDEELIKGDFDQVLEYRDEYTKFVKENPSSNAADLVRIAVEVLHDEELIDAIERDFSDVTIPGYE